MSTLPSNDRVMRCVRQYYEFLNKRLSRQLEEKHRMESRFPSEVLVCIAEFSAESFGIVVDNGSGFLKAGFVGDDAPRAIFDNSISTYHIPKDHNGGKNVTLWVGDEVPGNLSFRVPRFEYRPIDENGIISNWDEMEKVWRHTFVNELRVDPTEHPVLLTEPPLNPKANRERMARIMFETFRVPAMYVTTTSLLALFATGRTTGCVLDSGYAATHVVPIYEGYVLDHAVVSVNCLGGRELTEYLKKLIYERGLSPLGRSERAECNIINDIKETLCFVSADFEQDMKTAADSSILEKAYEFPNGYSLFLGNERFRCPEVLFQPSVMGLECAHSVATAVMDAVKKFGDDLDVHKTMYSNIVLSGGNTMFPGFCERLSKEINDYLDLDGSSLRIDTIAKPGSDAIACSGNDPRKLSWIGGSVLASLPQFQLSMWITREEYDEAGPSIIHRDWADIYSAS